MSTCLFCVHFNAAVAVFKVCFRFIQYWYDKYVLLTLEGPSTSIDVFSFRNACKMASVNLMTRYFLSFIFLSIHVFFQNFRIFQPAVTEKNM